MPRVVTTPTGRRRQRSSSSSTAPAEASPSIAISAARLRSSPGNSRCATALIAPGASVTLLRASNRPSSPSARTESSAGPVASARITVAVKSLSSPSAGASSRGSASASSASTRSGPRFCSPCAKLSALPSSIPSDSHTSSAPARSSAPSRASAASRSSGQGIGASALTAARASFGRITGSGGGAAAPGRGAVGSSTTLRPWRSALATRSSSVLRRSSQCRAAVQPLSTASTSGPLPASCAVGLSSGWARARMMSPASTMRRRISQSGVLAGVSSCGCRPSSRRSAGKRTRFGAGGVTRSSHQRIGNAASPSNSQGEAKASAPRFNMAASRALSHSLVRSRVLTPHPATLARCHLPPQGGKGTANPLPP